MAEDAGGEKSLPASPRKRREARKRGQVARSPDLSQAFVLLAMIIALHSALTSGTFFNSLKMAMDASFSFGTDPRGLSMASVRAWEWTAIQCAAPIMVPALLAAMVLGVLGNIAQVGLAVTPESLVPDFTRLSPATGIKRILSTQGAVQLGKGCLKMVLIFWICWSTVSANFPLLASAIGMPLVPFLGQVGDVVWLVGLRVSVVLFIMAVVDYGYQRFEFEKSLRMTREEMKQEMKQTDGDPFIKQKIRQKQRAMAQKRMMQQVPKATVVVTNPTHFAVALRYDKAMRAPTVVARGQDLIALRIKEIAAEHGVPTVENRPVARALFYEVRLGSEIPAQMYQAVAEILAFVYRGTPRGMTRS